MTEQLTRPPSLRAYLNSGCDLEAIPDLEDYAQFIILSQAMTWQDRAKLALTFDGTAEAWLAGEKAAPFGDKGPKEPTPELVRHYKWLAEGLMDNDLVEDFAIALPEDLRARCFNLLDEIEAEHDADLERQVTAEMTDLDETP